MPASTQPEEEKQRSRNAIAQKAQRERKAAYVRSLEDKIKLLEANATSGSAVASTSAAVAAPGPAAMPATPPPPADDPRFAQLAAENAQLKESLGQLQTLLTFLANQPASPSTSWQPSPPPEGAFGADPLSAEGSYLGLSQTQQDQAPFAICFVLVLQDSLAGLGFEAAGAGFAPTGAGAAVKEGMLASPPAGQWSTKPSDFWSLAQSPTSPPPLHPFPPLATSSSSQQSARHHRALSTSSSTCPSHHTLDLTPTSTASPGTFEFALPHHALGLAPGPFGANPSQGPPNLRLQLSLTVLPPWAQGQGSHSSGPPEYDPLQPRLGVDCGPMSGVGDNLGAPSAGLGKGAVANPWGSESLGGLGRPAKRQRLDSL